MFLAVWYVPISSSVQRPVGAAYIPVLLSEVEQEQRPSGNVDREAIVVGAGLCDGDGERAYITYAPHYIFALREFRTFRQKQGGGRLGEKNMPKRLRLKTFAETFRMICGAYRDVCTIALTVVKTSSHYDRFAISVPARSLLLFDLA